MSQGAAALKPVVNVEMDMGYLMRALAKYNASDLHLKVGRPPLFRVNGKLVAAKMPELRPEGLAQIIFPVMAERHRQELERSRQVDFSFRINDLGRFRCNVFYQRDSLAAAIRMIPLTVPQFDSLGLPPVLKELCEKPRGLVLVTGATGTGKSTTLAAMIQHMNETTSGHILCIEDPIEFIFKDRKSTITQRELGTDTLDLKAALRAGLRQDPDVLMIGELRDYETIQLAMTAAETGHLVFGTIHTNDSVGTIQRIVDVFPPESKNQARIQLASTLLAIVSQQLVLRSDGAGRMPACEVMIKSPVIEAAIMAGELSRIPELIDSSRDYYRMQSMNQALEVLVREGKITAEEALKSSARQDDLKLKLSGLVREQGYDLARIALETPTKGAIKLTTG